MVALLFAVAAGPYSNLCSALETQRVALGVPGAVLAVVRGGRVVLRQGFGTTEPGGKGRKVDAATVFEAASLTKPVFAATVLRLAERGTIDLDTPLVNLLGGTYAHRQQPWNPGGPSDALTDPRAVRITARMVLTHRSGLENIAFNRPLRFVGEPGRDWGYSGEGYIMLQRAVERVTGRSAPSLIEELVLRPRGMARSGFALTPATRANAARGMAADGTSVERIGQSTPLVAGSLLSTLDDYLRFLLWSRRQRGFLGTVVEADRANGVDWSLGWGLAHDGTDRDLFQWGWNDGYRNFAILNPRTGDGFLLFTASDRGMELVPPVMRTTFGRELPVLGLPMLGLQPR